MLFNMSGNRASHIIPRELNELGLKARPFLWKGTNYSVPNCVTPGIQKQVKEFLSVTRKQVTILFSIPKNPRISVRSGDQLYFITFPEISSVPLEKNSGT